MLCVKRREARASLVAASALLALASVLATSVFGTCGQHYMIFTVLQLMCIPSMASVLMSAQHQVMKRICF